MQKGCSICHSCGKKVEFTSDEPPCKALSGWLIVSHSRGPESVSHYSFCSFTCLQRWVDAQVPRVPEVFLKSLGEGKDKV